MIIPLPLRRDKLSIIRLIRKIPKCPKTKTPKNGKTDLPDEPAYQKTVDETGPDDTQQDASNQTPPGNGTNSGHMDCIDNEGARSSPNQSDEIKPTNSDTDRVEHVYL